MQVLADILGIPCRLVKGKQFTGSDDVAMNFVKIDGGRYVLFSCYILSYLSNYIVGMLLPFFIFQKPI